jgi:hypothetical protein
MHRLLGIGLALRFAQTQLAPISTIAPTTALALY